MSEPLQNRRREDSFGGNIKKHWFSVFVVLTMAGAWMVQIGSTTEKIEQNRKKIAVVASTTTRNTEDMTKDIQEMKQDVSVLKERSQRQEMDTQEMKSMLRDILRQMD